MEKISPVLSAPPVSAAKDVSGQRAAPSSAISQGRADVQTARRNGPPSVALVVDAIVAQGPPIDLAKIARIRTAIANGTYVIDPDRIAGAMLSMRAGEQ